MHCVREKNSRYEMYVYMGYGQNGRKVWYERKRTWIVSMIDRYK